MHFTATRDVENPVSFPVHSTQRVLPDSIFKVERLVTCHEHRWIFELTFYIWRDITVHIQISGGIWLFISTAVSAANPAWPQALCHKSVRTMLISRSAPSTLRDRLYTQRPSAVAPAQSPGRAPTQGPNFQNSRAEPLPLMEPTPGAVRRHQCTAQIVGAGCGPGPSAQTHSILYR
jgi:hypothetical protein